MASLFVVATPIGNLDDLSSRARQILAEVETVFCEDSRHSGRLLAQIRDAPPRYISLPPAQETARISRCLHALDSGDCALISDAGTPGFNDPGQAVVAAARQAGHDIVPIPGPNAVATLMSVAGRSVLPLVFLGFPSPKAGRAKKLLASVSGERLFVVLFAGPHRVGRLLGECAEVYGPETECIIGRELTKRFEDIQVKSLAQWLTAPPRAQGEFTLGLWVGAWKTSESETS